jgi:ABC-type multidrug transport system ATPase subunit
MWEEAGLRPPPVGVKEARSMIRARGLPEPSRFGHSESDGIPRRARWLARRRWRAEAPALELDRLWVEYDDGTGAGLTALRGLKLTVERGETLALLGRNGAGKSTLLRTVAGLRRATRGRFRVAGEIALVLQNPADYFVHERVRDELPEGLADAALADVGLAHAAPSNSRDLSGGERQRLALAIVLAGRGIGGGTAPAVVALDEPTRGMDREHKHVLSSRLRRFAESGSAVIVATQDMEFAARVADRSVLLAEGRVIADAPTRDLLSGGRYFATDVARVLGPDARVILPEDGAHWLRQSLPPGDQPPPASPKQPASPGVRITG